MILPFSAKYYVPLHPKIELDIERNDRKDANPRLYF